MVSVGEKISDPGKSRNCSEYSEFEGRKFVDFYKLNMCNVRLAAHN